MVALQELIESPCVANTVQIRFHISGNDSDEFLYKQGTHYETLEAWQAATGWDANSIQLSGQPQTPWIYLRENKYESDHAHLVIYNWSDADTVTADMNDLWPDGVELQEGKQYQYRIVNVENIWGEPVVEGTLTNGTIEVPLHGEFTCYLVTRQTRCPYSESDEILFCLEADGEIISTPAIGDDGTIYFGTQNATLYAVDCNGILKWTWRYDLEDWWGPLAFEAAPVIGDDGTIYVADDIAIPNYLFAISPEGQKKWEYITHVVYGSMDASPVLLSDGTIFAGGYGGGRSFSGQLVALTPDGTVLEGFPIDTGAILASPVVVDDVVIAGADAGRRVHNEVLAVNKSANIIWNIELDGDVDGSRWYSVSSLAVDCYKNIFVVNNCENYFSETGLTVLSSSIVQLDPVNGEILFEMEIPTDSIVVGSPVIDAAEVGANVIVATQNAYIISLNPYADGEKLNYDLVLSENSEAVGSPVIGDNGKLYHAVNSVTNANQIDIFEINADGTINDNFDVTITNDQVSSSLTMGNNGVLYFGTKQGKLYAVQTSANALSSNAPWPTFRHDTRNTGNPSME